MSRRIAFVSTAAVVLVIALAAGVLAVRSTDDGGGGPPALRMTEATGPDGGVANDERRASVYIPAAGEAPPSAEYLAELRQAIENQHTAAVAQQEEAAATAVARTQDESVAARAIREWGGGQLLMSLPSIGVTAAVSAIGFEPGTRTPSTPSTPWGVGWYTFTDYPGVGGNAVFSGHVDWYTGAPAVFGGLSRLRSGDPIYMVLSDGRPIAYQVAQSYYVTPYTADVGEIFGVTAGDAVTFITCGGSWDAVAHDYSHRLIVRAYRVR